jgi:hypothetical protein
MATFFKGPTVMCGNRSLRLNVWVQGKLLCEIMMWPQTFYLSPDFLEMNTETLKLGMSAGHKRACML